METATVNSTFRFSKYIIKESLMNIKDFAVSNELDIEIDVTPLFDTDKSEDQVSLMVDLRDKNDNFSLHIKMTGYFVSEMEDDNQRKNFICLNAPAILFPYVRTYISSMTSQAGIGAVILPTINLHSYGKRLLEKLNSKKS